MNDRTCGGYYNPMPMPPMMPYQNIPMQQSCNNSNDIYDKINMLEKRIASLEKIVGTNNYNNYQMM